MDITASTDVLVSDKEPLRPSHLLSSSYALWTSAFTHFSSELEWKGPDVRWEESPDLREGFRKTKVKSLDSK